MDRIELLSHIPLFESLEPSYTGVPLEVRHPYCDIRLLRFMLSVSRACVVPEIIFQRPGETA